MMSSFKATDNLYLSELTLAVLLDTHFWYRIDMGYAETKYMTFGRSRGCEFLFNYSCQANPDYCSTSNKRNVTFYHNAFGTCMNTPLFRRCKVVSANVTTFCKDTTFLGVRGDRNITLDYMGPDAQGYMATVINNSYQMPASPEFRCFKTTCAADLKSMLVYVGIITFNCSINGQ
jgi:hypothetical protein